MKLHLPRIAAIAITLGLWGVIGATAATVYHATRHDTAATCRTDSECEAATGISVDDAMKGAR